MDPDDTAAVEPSREGSEARRTTAGEPRKSERLRSRPLPAAHRRSTPRPLGLLVRRGSRRPRTRLGTAQRRWLAATAAGVALGAGLGAETLGLAGTTLAVGAGLGLLLALLPVGAVPALAARCAERDGALVRGALAVGPLAVGLAPGLALLPSLRWSLLALPAVGFAVAAGGLWWTAAWAPWVWRASAGAVLAWGAHLAAGSLGHFNGPPAEAAGAPFQLAAGAAVAWLGWRVAAHLESALDGVPDP